MGMGLSKSTTSRLSCDASNCFHSLPGNRCGAARIRIADQNPGRPAANAGDTCCLSFRYRHGLGEILSSLTNLNWRGLLREPSAEGVQVEPTIECSVENCLYRNEGEGCGAGMVRIGKEGATASGETDCSTFLPKQS